MTLNKKHMTVAGALLAVLLAVGLASPILNRLLRAEITSPPAPSASVNEADEENLGTPADDDSVSSEASLYEIVGREVDGTMVVQTEFMFYHTEQDIRWLTQDGKPVEQVYDLVSPVTERVEVRVPPGKDVWQYLDEVYRKHVGSEEPIAEVTVLSRHEGEQFEISLFAVRERRADGTATVEIQYHDFETRLQIRDNESVQQICVVPTRVSKVRTMTLPIGSDLDAYLNDHPDFLYALESEMLTMNEQIPPPEEVYEIIGQQPDGTTLVRHEYIDSRVETRVRQVDRDGKTVEQVYDLIVPVMQYETWEVPAGQDVLDFVGEISSPVEPAPAPPAPGDDEDLVPPAPAVGLDA